jgi:hypothetical protein
MSSQSFITSCVLPESGPLLPGFGVKSFLPDLVQLWYLWPATALAFVLVLYQLSISHPTVNYTTTEVLSSSSRSCYFASEYKTERLKIIAMSDSQTSTFKMDESEASNADRLRFIELVLQVIRDDKKNTRSLELF